MSRSLHITINEGAGDSPRRASYVPVYAPGSTSGNPGSDYVMPPPVDSGGPKNPSEGSSGTGALGSGYLTPSPTGGSTVIVSDHGCCCGAGSSSGSAAGSTP